MIKKDCIFCKIINGELPSYNVYKDEDIIAFFDISLGNDFHTLVVPKKHYENIFDIDEEILAKLIKVTKKICKEYEDKFGIEHINLVQSNGKFAGQEIFHYHMHILPRMKDDGNIFKFNIDLNNDKRLSENLIKVKGLINS